MEIVQMQSRDAKESLAKIIASPPLQIKIPRAEFAEERCDPSVRVEEGENVKNESWGVQLVQEEGGNEEKENLPIARVQDEEKEDCTTPRGAASRIPVILVCPPPPERRSLRENKRTREIPSEKFFPVPDDLNSVFIPRKKMFSQFKLL